MLRRIKQLSHRAALTAGGKDMEHLLAALTKPAVQAPSIGWLAGQQGAIEVGDEHQLRSNRQGRLHLRLKACPHQWPCQTLIQ